jgi:hypothetical protein
MKTINQTYDTICERYENCQLSRHQVEEFEMLQQDLADGSIDGDDFSFIWNEMFPNF